MATVELDMGSAGGCGAASGSGVVSNCLVLGVVTFATELLNETGCSLLVVIFVLTLRKFVFKKQLCHNGELLGV